LEQQVACQGERGCAGEPFSPRFDRQERVTLGGLAAADRLAPSEAGPGAAGEDLDVSNPLDIRSALPGAQTGEKEPADATKDPAGRPGRLNMAVVPKKILIVDDDPVIVETLTAILRDSWETYIVDRAANGSDALAAIASERPDLVLLDVALPDINGLEVLRRVRSIDPSLPVIMITGMADRTAFSEAMRSGAFGYIPKPFDIRQIEPVVAMALERSQSTGR
jgi:two-component system chemotaxis response regulator CheY